MIISMWSSLSGMNLKVLLDLYLIGIQVRIKKVKENQKLNLKERLVYQNQV